METVYEPAFYSRVGLRYQDAIDKTELGLSKEPWERLLSQAIVGPLGDPGVSHDVVGQQGEILFGLTEVEGAYATLRHRLERNQEGKEVYVIDSDFFTDQKTRDEQIFHVLDTFNRFAGYLFRWAITPRLAQALGDTNAG